MSRSKATSWVVGTAVLGVLILAGAWFLLVSPRMESAADLRFQAESEAARADQLEIQLLGLKADAENIETFRTELAQLRVQMPAATELASLTRQLNDVAQQAGVFVSGVSPNTASAVEAPAAPVAAPVETTEGTAGADGANASGAGDSGTSGTAGGTGGAGGADLEDQRLLQHQRAVAGDGGGAVGSAAFGHRGLPAGLVGRVHASTSWSAEARVSMSSSEVVSVNATTSPSCSASCAG